MQFSLNQNSCYNLSLIEFMQFAKNFNGVELNFKKIEKALFEGLTLKEILDILVSYRLKTCSIYALKDFSLSSDKDYKEKVMSQFKQMIHYCYTLESDLLIVNPSIIEESTDSIKIPQERIVKRTIKRIEDLSKIADKNDINLGFEFLYNSSIPTLSMAIEVVGALESRENLGYVIDTFHFVKSKASLSQLKNIAQLIYLIQLSDLKFDSIDQLTSLKDSDRSFPGEGNFNLKSFMDNAIKIGYKNMFSIELSKNESIENLNEKYFKFLNY